MVSERVEQLLVELTLEEKVGLLSGTDMWHARGVPRLGVPLLKVSDGPIGARGGEMAGGIPSACFPCGTALGATWNVALVERVGQALGEETRAKGAQVLLAPTVNIHRTPLAGRNFEAFSEDPTLTARLAVAYVRGVQSRDVGCSIKHFVCNDSEHERHTISSDVDPRALREIYLPPFEAVVREARPWSVMSAYNRINGVYACDHRELLEDVLRREWGFDGFVVSDWFGLQSTAEAVVAGNDLEMPGPGIHRREKLLEAVRAGALDEKAVDACARRMLAARERAGLLGAGAGPGPERAEDRPEHRALAREAARESMVLLRNERSLLPFDPGALRSLAVIGPNADVARVHGGGSCRVEPHYEVSPLQGIRARLGEGVDVRFEPGCSAHRAIPPLDGRWTRADSDPVAEGVSVAFFDGLACEGEPVLSRVSRRVDFQWLGQFHEAVDPASFSVRVGGVFTAPADGTYTFSLVTAGRARLFLDEREVIDAWTQQERGDAFYGMGSAEQTHDAVLRAGQVVALRAEYSKEGAPVMGGLRIGCLRRLPEDALAQALRAAADADAAVVVVGLDADWETEGRDRPSMALPGEQAELVRRVAVANPRTAVILNAGSPVDCAPFLDTVPAALVCWYPGQELGNALAELLFGDVCPSGRLPQTWPVRIEDTPAFLHYPGERGHVAYGEGVFVGYRSFDARRIEPRFPFGHGLSYTSFAYGALAPARERIRSGEDLPVALDVTNTGERAGQEVVQLYVSDLEASVARPPAELAAFAKVALEPGETRRVELVVPARAFAFWDPAAGDWTAEPGAFELRAGASSRDVRSRARVELEAPA